MKRLFVVILSGAMLLICAHRLPAPISEETPTPATKPLPSRKTNSSSHPKVGSEFNGVWRRDWSEKTAQGYNFSGTTLVTVTGGNSAVVTDSVTGTLLSGQSWPNWPSPYNTISPVHTQWYSKASELRLEGSSLRFIWPDAHLTDWSPKAIPYSVINSNWPAESEVCSIAESRLVCTDGKKSWSFIRVR